MRPKVSVIMPVYNAGRYLNKAIESILIQTFTDFEFVIINDGSKDNSLDIIRTYNDPRIRLINKKHNEGVVKALNDGLRGSRGEFIARQDADDISLKDRLAHQYEFLAQNIDIALVGTQALYIGPDDVPRHKLVLPCHDAQIRKVIFHSCVFCSGSVMFRRKAIEAVGCYRPEFLWAEDYDLWLRIAEKFPVANLSQVFYMLRRAILSITSRGIEEMCLFTCLAIAMSNERRERGCDSLETIDIPNIKREVLKRMPMTESELMRRVENMAFWEYKGVRRFGFSLALFRLWLAFFLCDRAKWKIRVFFQDLLAPKAAPLGRFVNGDWVETDC